MKILFLSWHFPSTKKMGALRIRSLVKFFHSKKCDIRVFVPKIDDECLNLDVPIPPELIVQTNFFDIGKIIHPISSRRKGIKGKFSTGWTPGLLPGQRYLSIAGARRAIGTFYHNIWLFPDRGIGWVPPLVKAGAKLFDEWRPDMIYASGPPFSTLVGAHFLSRRTGVPWVAEFRDRWVDDPYGSWLPWRRGLESLLERHVIGSASAIVTVSEPWAKFYQSKYSKPTAVVYNGYDSADYRAKPADGVPNGRLRIVYTGGIYAGRRDPSPLFEAISDAGFRPDEIEVRFYGTQEKLVHPLIKKFSVEDFVSVHPSVPYLRSVEIQRTADILLLLQWNDPREQGNIPGKLFEYFGAMRPILGIGYEGGVPAKLIRERNAGAYSSDPGTIRQHLRGWISEKRDKGLVAPLPESVRAGFSRDEQGEVLERFLREVLGGKV